MWKILEITLSIIIYIYLLNYTLWIFLPLYIFWIFFWFYKLLCYILINTINELKPQKIPHKNKWFHITEHWVYHFYTIVVIRPYLSAYASLYFILNKKFNRISKLAIILTIMFKILTGVSLVLVQKAIKYAKKIMLILEFEATSIKAYVSTIFFNLNLFEFDDLLLFEKLKIYKTSDRLFNFNPDFEKLKLIFGTLLPRLDINACKKINPRDKSMKIITNLRGRVESKSIKGNLSAKGSRIKHYGSYYKFTPKDGLVINYTSKEGLKMIDIETQNIVQKKNFVISDKSFVTKPIITKLDAAQIEEIKLEDNDLRVFFEELKISSTLFVLGLASKQDEFFSIDELGNLTATKIEDCGNYLRDIKRIFDGAKLAKPLQVWYDIELDVIELQKHLTINDFKDNDIIINYLIAVFNDPNIEQKFYGFAIKKIEENI